MQVLIVLTDRWSHQRNEPSGPGIARLRRFADVMQSAKIAFDPDIYAIIGGWEDAKGISLAEHYCYWFRGHYPKFAGIKIELSFTTNNTVDDIIGYYRKLKLKYPPNTKFEFYLVTGKSHYLRMIATCEELGIIPFHVDSDEAADENTLSPTVQNFLHKISRFDPLWNKPTGWFLREWANHRAAMYKRSRE